MSVKLNDVRKNPYQSTSVWIISYMAKLCTTQQKTSCKSLHQPEESLERLT